MKNPDGVQSTWLTRYVYLNGFANRLSSGTQSKLTEDLRHLDALVQGEEPSLAVPVAISPEDIKETGLRIGNAYCKSVLCLLAAQQPRDLRDGSAILLNNRALKRANSRHFHHIFPKAYMRGKVGVEHVNSVANVSLIPADLNLKIGSKPPSVYLASFSDQNNAWSECLDSHVITAESRDSMESDEFVTFLDSRSRQLSELAHEAVGKDPIFAPKL